MPIIYHGDRHANSWKLAQLLAELGRPDEALQEAIQAAKLQPTNPRYRALVTQLRQQLNNPRGAKYMNREDSTPSVPPDPRAGPLKSLLGGLGILVGGVGGYYVTHSLILAFLGTILWTLLFQIAAVLLMPRRIPAILGWTKEMVFLFARSVFVLDVLYLVLTWFLNERLKADPSLDAIAYFHAYVLGVLTLLASVRFVQFKRREIR